MQFQVTNAGLAAAFAASNNGPAIRIGVYKIGAGFGYVPGVLDTALHGDELHSDSPTAYKVLDANTSEFTIRMNQTVGTWAFGEVGLYLVTGELFALGSLTRPQWKVAYPDRDYNLYEVKIRLTLNGVIPKIELVVEELTLGLIQELPSVDYLPLIAETLNNAFICHSKDARGNEAFATVGDNRWTIHSHMGVAYTGAITDKNVNGTEVEAVGLTLEMATPGKYLIQFLSGSAKGATRQVLTTENGKVGWALPELNSQIGDTFEILHSKSEGDSSDDAFFYSLLGR